MPGPLPLNALLAQPLITLAQEFGGPPSMAVVANVLRPIGDGLAVADLPAAARLSKRAVRTALNTARKAGYVATDDGWARVTPSGAEARRVVDDKWPQLRAPLAALVAQLPLEWPHFPTGYGTADHSATGGVWRGVTGTDWKPVHRVLEDDTVSGLPVSALLSQAYMAFTADYESLGLGALYWAANVLRRIPDDGAPTGDFPDLRNLPGNGKSTLERHLFITITGNPKSARVTTRGADVRDRYEGAVKSVEDQWRADYGEGTVSAVRAELEALDVDRAQAHAVMGALWFY